MYVSVQYLRAIAAISVVLFHLSSHAGAGENYGVLACGVDLFFIISGFIINKSSVHENSASRFLLKRIIRIYPLWLCGLLIYIFMTHFVDGAQYDAQQILTSLTLIFHFNAVQGFVAPIYKIGWTLSLEMLFYLSWAAMVFLLPSENSIAAKQRSIAITFAFIVMIVAVKALLRLTSIMSLESPLSRLGDVHILEFCMGAMFAAFEQEMLRNFGRFRLWIAGGGIVLLTALEFRHSTWPVFLRLGVPLFLIFFAFVASERAIRKSPSKLGILLGDASYSIYLFHSLILRFVYSYLLDIPVTRLTILPCLISITALCVIVHLALEKPLTAGIIAIAPASEKRPLGMTTSTVPILPDER